MQEICAQPQTVCLLTRFSPGKQHGTGIRILFADMHLAQKVFGVPEAAQQASCKVQAYGVMSAQLAIMVAKNGGNTMSKWW